MATSPVLDTVVLQAFGFGHARGIKILLEALGTDTARFPAEVYNADEAALPLEREDETLSELARGLRYAQRQLLSRPPDEAQRYRRWVDRAAQLHDHLSRGSLTIDLIWNPGRSEGKAT